MATQAAIRRANAAKASEPVVLVVDPRTGQAQPKTTEQLKKAIDRLERRVDSTSKGRLQPLTEEKYILSQAKSQKVLESIEKHTKETKEAQQKAARSIIGAVSKVAHLAGTAFLLSRLFKKPSPGGEKPESLKSMAAKGMATKGLEKVLQTLGAEQSDASKVADAIMSFNLNKAYAILVAGRKLSKTRKQAIERVKAGAAPGTGRVGKLKEAAKAAGEIANEAWEEGQKVANEAFSKGLRDYMDAVHKRARQAAGRVGKPRTPASVVDILSKTSTKVGGTAKTASDIGAQAREGVLSKLSQKPILEALATKGSGIVESLLSFAPWLFLKGKGGAALGALKGLGSSILGRIGTVGGGIAGGLSATGGASWLASKALGAFGSIFGGGLSAGSRLLGVGAKVAGKAALPISLGLGAFDAWSDREKSEYFLGKAPGTATMGDKVSTMLGSLAHSLTLGGGLGLVSKEKMIKWADIAASFTGIKDVANVIGKIGDITGFSGTGAGKFLGFGRSAAIPKELKAAISPSESARRALGLKDALTEGVQDPLKDHLKSMEKLGKKQAEEEEDREKTFFEKLVATFGLLGWFKSGAEARMETPEGRVAAAKKLQEAVETALPEAAVVSGGGAAAERAQAQAEVQAMEARGETPSGELYAKAAQAPGITGAGAPGGRYVPQPGDEKYFSDPQKLAGLQSSFVEKLKGVAQETGTQLPISSGYRSPERQKELYDAWIASGKQGAPVAPPGRSFHEEAAIDLKRGWIEQNPQVAAAFEKYGLGQLSTLGGSVAAETWHIQPKETLGMSLSAYREKLTKEQPSMMAKVFGPKEAQASVIPPGTFSRGVQPDGVNERIQTAMSYFQSKGYTKEAAAGIVGNLLHESAGTLDPSIKQFGGGPGFGIAQWEGSRKTALMNFAQQRGVSPTDLKTQLDFIYHEMQGGTGDVGAQKAGQLLMQSGLSSQQATEIFSKHFERPGKPMMSMRQQATARVLGLPSAEGQFARVPTSPGAFGAPPANPPQVSTAPQGTWSAIPQQAPGVPGAEQLANTFLPIQPTAAPVELPAFATPFPEQEARNFYSSERKRDVDDLGMSIAQGLIFS